MGDAQDGRSRSLVDASRFDADEPVFDHIHAADAVFLAERVEVEEEFERPFFGRAVFSVDDTGGNPILEMDIDTGFLVGGVPGRFGEGENAFLLRFSGPAQFSWIGILFMGSRAGLTFLPDAGS